MIDRYERLPQWVQWALLPPLSLAYALVLTMILKWASSLLYRLFLPTVAIVSFICALHELAPRWKNGLVVVALILRMLVASLVFVLVLISGAMPHKTLWFEVGMELLGWAAGWFLYFSVFREGRTGID